MKNYVLILSGGLRAGFFFEKVYFNNKEETRDFLSLFYFLLYVSKLDKFSLKISYRSIPRNYISLGFKFIYT